MRQGLRRSCQVDLEPSLQPLFRVSGAKSRNYHPAPRWEGVFLLSSPSDTTCASLLPMSSVVSLLLWFGFFLLFSFNFPLFLLLFFCSAFFLFSLFVFFVCFVFLHVQFCKANSRYCISQLVSLQRKFTVSCSLLRYSLNGFLI